MVTSRNSQTTGRREGSSVEKRSHPSTDTPPRRCDRSELRCGGGMANEATSVAAGASGGSGTGGADAGANPAASAAAAAAAAGFFNSSVILHLAKGRRISGGAEGGAWWANRGDVVLALPEAGPGCRAMVPYTANPRRPSRKKGEENSSSTATKIASPPPSLMTLTPPLPGDYTPPSSSLCPSPCSSPSPLSSSSSSSRRFFDRSHAFSPDAPRSGARSVGSSSSSSTTRQVEIPLEVFPIVFQYMDASTLCSVSSVSKEWSRQGNDDEYWRRLCRARFNVTPDAFRPPPGPTKRLYQLQHGSFKAMCKGCRYGSGLRFPAPPSISPHTSAQLLMGLMMSNAM